MGSFVNPKWLDLRGCCSAPQEGTCFLTRHLLMRRSWILYLPKWFLCLNSLIYFEKIFLFDFKSTKWKSDSFSSLSHCFLITFFMYSLNCFFGRKQHCTCSFKSHKLTLQVEKMVFVVFFSGEQARTKILKICEAFGASCYPVPEDITKQRQITREVSF